MYDELIHMTLFLTEAGHAVAALFRRAKFMFEQGIVLCADYCKVKGHGCAPLESVVEMEDKPDCTGYLIICAFDHLGTPLVCSELGRRLGGSH